MASVEAPDRMRSRVPEGLSFWLDVVRGGAAMLVVLAHTRIHYFGGWAENSNGPFKIVLLPFYILTGMGHEAVVLFFVMSGYLVGRKFPLGVGPASVDMRVYIVDRLSRIWLVLIPAVILSVLVSYVLLDIYGYSYSGADERCSPPVADILATIFFLNEGYLKTVCSNGPAWSIHSEVHYYLLWPLLIFALSRSMPGRLRLGSAIVVGCVVAALLAFDQLDTKNTLVLAPIWIAGAFLDRVPAVRLPLWVLGGLLVTAMAAPSVAIWGRMWPLSDYVIGALALLFFAKAREAECIKILFKKFAAWLAGISFTLYLTHIIIVTAIRTVLEHGEGVRFPIVILGPHAAGLYAFTVAAALIFAQAFWWIFESRTGNLRRFLLRSKK
ncbi:acyltransferase family protein [Novosphingobium soli]|uniref:Acyltransferase family protein n=1 Tax=Novosphingobium soli TaxID=574956 RepID=A0ABV6CWA7_9SPHN